MGLNHIFKLTHSAIFFFPHWRWRVFKVFELRNLKNKKFPAGIKPSKIIEIRPQIQKYSGNLHSVVCAPAWLHYGRISKCDIQFARSNWEVNNSSSSCFRNKVTREFEFLRGLGAAGRWSKWIFKGREGGQVDSVGSEAEFYQFSGKFQILEKF